MGAKVGDKEEMIGQTFGSLVVRTREENDKHGKKMWGCSCSCGKEWVVARTDNLVSGRTTSCRKGACGGRGGRPTNAERAESSRSPDNAFVEKINITAYYCADGLDKNQLWGFAVATGQGIRTHLATDVEATNKRYKTIRGVPVRGEAPSFAIKMMDLLMDGGYVEDQGDRRYEQWMHDCGVSYKEVGTGDALRTRLEHERITGITREMLNSVVIGPDGYPE